MRIQHNIMAMSAYRNYTNNVSAMKKNLEKLSSGYKINRAGDDAAGLAISEKMRAQITGLETAQKNAKDGISLVQTAEGALTEVHDMLNRMVELASMSANGTYDNTTDRAQLQKEMDQLTSEIDRIADSSNFNGIKLLDGSMDAGGETVVTEGKFQFAANHGGNVSTGNVALPTVGQTLGTNTVLHAGATAGSAKTEFSVELHNLEFDNAAGSSMTITIGDEEFTLKGGAHGTAGTKLSASDIAAAFKAGKFVVGDKDSTTAMTADQATIGGVAYDVTVSNGKITFSSTADLPDGTEIPATVAITGDDGNGTAPTTAQAATYSFELTAGTGTFADGDVITIGGQTINVVDAGTGDITAADAADLSKLAVVAAAKLQAAGNADYNIASDGAKIVYTAKTAGALGGVGAPAAAPAAITAGGAAAAKVTVGAMATEQAGADAGDAVAAGSSIKGDYNVSTTDIVTKAAPTDKRLASTHFTLTNDMVADGSTITIGTKTYTFTTDKDKIGEEGYVDATSGDLATIATNLTDTVAKDNTTYTLGTDATPGHITITEIDGQTDFDLTTMNGIEASLGFTTSTTSPVDSTKGLTLQIGDTADSFNQLKVSIKDMHANSLGIDKGSIKISDQASAATAIEKIKAAINKVSDVRGTLGATQNRLDHTINNLSVMTENIQDAESTIRDVDVAEEMMAYTKNNILIQSAQAMLAQANQVPQGVLQLLQ